MALPTRFPLLTVTKVIEEGKPPYFTVPRLSEQALMDLIEISEQYHVLREPWTREEKLKSLLLAALPEWAELPMELDEIVAALVTQAFGPNPENVRPAMTLTPQEIVDLETLPVDDGRIALIFESPEQLNRLGETLLYAMATHFRY